MKFLGSNSAVYGFCLFPLMVAYLFMSFLLLSSELTFTEVFSIDSWRLGLKVGTSREN